MGIDSEDFLDDDQHGDWLAAQDAQRKHGMSAHRQRTRDTDSLMRKPPVAISVSPRPGVP